MKKFRAHDSMHNRNVAQRKQFVVILNKIPENPKPNRNPNYVPYRTSTTNVLRHYVTGECKVLSFHFVLRSLTTITKAGNWVDFNFFGARLVIHSDIPIIVNCLFIKWLLVVPLCMLSVAAQYKMFTERLVTVSTLSGQILVVFLTQVYLEKRPLKWRASIWLCGPPWVWVIIHCMCWVITCEIWFCRRFSWEWLIDQSRSD